MDLEKIATSAIVSSISKTDTLSGFINDGDKEPCWDQGIRKKNDIITIFIYMKIPDIRRRILKEYLLRLRGKLSRQNR